MGIENTEQAIIYTDSLDGITAENLTGFFVGWLDAPSSETHLKILQNAYTFWLAVESETHQVVGFINVISDGIQAAFIPNLEVLPAYQKRGIGSELVRRTLAALSHLYSIDLSCDPEIRPFYERLGLRPMVSMSHRNYDRQAGQ